MKKYRYYLLALKNSLMSDMEYRADFAVVVIQATVFVIFNILFYNAIYGNMGAIGDWTLPQMVALFGVYTIVDGIFMSFINPSLSGLETLVREGLLDSYLVKPMDSQFLISSRKMNIKEIPSILLGVVIFLYGVTSTGVIFTVPMVLLFLGMLVLTTILYYSMTLIICNIVFYLDKAEELHEIIFSIKQFSKFPDIYRGFSRYLFMFGFPIVFSSFVPAGIIFGKVSTTFVVYYTVITVVFAVISRLNWKHALKYYKSAGG